MRRPALALVSVAGLAVGPAWADEDPGFREELPEFTLHDPIGRAFDRDDLLTRGLVLVVTAPTWANSDAQEGWCDHLQRTRPEGAGGFVFLEDLSPSWFVDTALARMREAYEPERPPVLLIDPEGELRAELGVDANETVLLVYDADGELLHAETGEPSAARARRAWRALRPPADERSEPVRHDPRASSVRGARPRPPRETGAPLDGGE